MEAGVAFNIADMLPDRSQPGTPNAQERGMACPVNPS